MFVSLSTQLAVLFQFYVALMLLIIQNGFNYISIFISKLVQLLNKFWNSLCLD